MALTNFGSILKFAEEMEIHDNEFYKTQALDSKYSQYKEIFEDCAKVCEKNKKLILRIRRENITEMILEPVNGLNSSEFELKLKTGDNVVIENALKIENRAKNYYLKAAEKIKAQLEVSRGLKQAAKKRSKSIKKLMAA